MVLAATVTEIEALPTIDDIFLIYRDGRLISHHTRKLRPDVDDEILSGMFSAVSEFIKRSFGEEGVEEQIDEISYGGRKILIEHGRYVFIAMVVSGGETLNMRKNTRNAVQNIEAEFGEVLDGWSGATNELIGAKRWIQMLITGKAVPGDEPVDETIDPMISKVDEPEEKDTGPKTRTIDIDGTDYTKAMMLDKLTSLPRGLPSGLWGKDMDELAENIMNGEFSASPDGDPVVKLGRKWYYGDPKDLGNFLQPYKGELADRPEDARAGLKQAEVETEQKGHDDELTFEQSKKVKRS
jgi:hypothetical protein